MNINDTLIDYVNEYQEKHGDKRIETIATGGGCDFIYRRFEDGWNVVIASSEDCGTSPDTLDEICCLTVYPTDEWYAGVSFKSGNFIDTVAMLHNMESFGDINETLKSMFSGEGKTLKQSVLDALQSYDEIGGSDNCRDYRESMEYFISYINESIETATHDFDESKYKRFLNSREWQASLYPAVDIPELKDCPGYTYGLGGYIQFNPDTGLFSVDIENHGTQSVSRSYVESYLFQHWAQFEMPAPIPPGDWSRVEREHNGIYKEIDFELSPDWTDISWHNDAAASWINDSIIHGYNVRLWVAEKNVEEREISSGKRFTLAMYNGGSEGDEYITELGASDNFDHIKRLIEDIKRGFDLG